MRVEISHLFLKLRYLNVSNDIYNVKSLRIPSERVPILIGEEGKALEEIESLLKVDIDAESEGVVEIESDDPMGELRAYNIVKAIGRGFSPERALRLMEKNSTLYIIDITDFASTENSKRRLKGRVIGRDGQARNHIENVTNTEISVYGKTVAIIGNSQNVELAKKTVEMLLNGRSHSTAWNFLEKNLQKIK